MKNGVKYAYTLEVFPTGDSLFGFLVIPEHIRPSGEEVSEAFFTAAENIQPIPIPNCPNASPGLLLRSPRLTWDTLGDWSSIPLITAFCHSILVLYSYT